MNKFYNQIYSVFNNLKLKFHNYFKIPLASKKKYLALHIKAQKNNYSKVNEYESRHKFQIDKIWFEKLALHTQVVVKKSEINYQHGRILYALFMSYIDKRKYHTKFFQVFETGTARGFSALCMSKALLDSNVDGNIATIDILPHTKKMIWNCINDCDDFVSRKDILSKWSKEVENINFLQGKSSEIIKELNFKRINFAFLDAHHITKEVINEFNFVQEKQIKGDIIFFDDVTPALYPGVVKALKIIKGGKDYSIEYLFISEERQYAIATKN